MLHSELAGAGGKESLKRVRGRVAQAEAGAWEKHGGMGGLASG